VNGEFIPLQNQQKIDRSMTDDDYKINHVGCVIKTRLVWRRCIST